MKLSKNADLNLYNILPILIIWNHHRTILSQRRKELCGCHFESDTERDSYASQLLDEVCKCRTATKFFKMLSFYLRTWIYQSQLIVLNATAHRQSIKPSKLEHVASYLPSHSETKPTQKEDNMPPMEKMATDRDQRVVRVPAGMGSPYRSTHVEL